MKMGSRTEHELILDDVITEFRKRGLKVIRLKKKVPDGILIIDDKIIALEISSSEIAGRISRKRKEFKNTDFDNIIIFGKKNSDYVPPEAYHIALKLRKKGMKYKDIKKIIDEEFPNVKVGIPTICNWCKGNSKPHMIDEN